MDDSLSTPRPLSEELSLRMRKQRLKMRQLGLLANKAAERIGARSIHWSVITAIINSPRRKGREIRPEADTLRAIALGLATDPLDATKIDHQAAAEHFKALMRAAGYTDYTGPKTALDELERDLQAFVKEPAAAMAFAGGITDWDKLDLAGKEFIVRAIRLARRQSGLPRLPGEPESIPEPDER